MPDEKPVRTDVFTGEYAGPVLVAEDDSDKFAAAVYPDLVEDRLQVVLHGEGGNVQALRDLGGRATEDDLAGYFPLAWREAVGEDDELG